MKFWRVLKDRQMASKLRRGVLLLLRRMNGIKYIIVCNTTQRNTIQHNTETPFESSSPVSLISSRLVSMATLEEEIRDLKAEIEGYRQEFAKASSEDKKMYVGLINERGKTLNILLQQQLQGNYSPCAYLFNIAALNSIISHPTHYSFRSFPAFTPHCSIALLT
jgi:hypothetical protein